MHVVPGPVIDPEQKHACVKKVLVPGKHKRVSVVEKAFERDVHVGYQGIGVYPKDPVTLISIKFLCKIWILAQAGE